MKAVFLDRDDTIIVDKINQYKPDEIEYFQDTWQALKVIQDKGYALFMVTNQSGVTKGLFDTVDVQLMHNRIERDMMAQGLEPFHDILFCPAHDHNDKHNWRKPKPGMIEELCLKWKVDKSQSFMLGDKIRDAESGHNAGLKESHLIGQKAKDDRFRNFDTLSDFADYLP